MKKLILFCLFITLGLYASAQSMSVKSFKPMPTDLTASSLNGKRIDQNGEVAALIKIETTQTGFIFEGGSLGIVDTKQEIGEIWVWVPRGLRKITIKHQQLGILRDYIFPVSIESERTYQMILSTDRIETIVKHTIQQQYLVFQITPPNATLEVNDQFWEIESDGSATKYMNFGTYTYRVQAPNYHIEAGQATVNDPDNAKVVIINLQPNFGWIEVPAQGNLQGASVYVDNVLVGKVPCKSEALKSGPHNVRIAKEMYDSFSGTVTVNDNETTRFTPTLKANFAEITLKVDDDAEIWVNNERKGIRSWTGPLGSGTYRVECKMPNHEPSVTSQTITADMKGQTITLPHPKPIYGAVSIESTPNLCDIAIDGKNVGVTPKFIPELLIGTHQLTLSKKGYIPTTTTFTLTEGERKELKLKMGTEPTDKLIKKGDNYRLKKQYAEAIRCYQAAMELDDLEGQQRMGVVYEYGYGVKKDAQEALRLYTDAAQKGNPVAQNVLGSKYMYGRLVKADKAEGVKWYRMAAEQGHPAGQDNLAGCYKEGKGVPKNMDEANRWYRAAAEGHREKAKQGDGYSMERLAYYYKEGLGVKRDVQESNRWYQEALKVYLKEAEEGIVSSQYRAGDFYHYGYGVKKNDVEALKWYGEAAKQGDDANYSIADIYYYGGHGVKKDLQKALQYYLLSAEDGNWRSMESVADMYKNGKGVEKNETKAQQYYDRAMDTLMKSVAEGDAYSMRSVGDRYRNGKGVAKDIGKALQWYQKSYEAGNDDVLVTIGSMYEREKDYQEAMKWYQLGAEKNNATCQSDIGSLYFYGYGVTKNYDEAMKWFRQAADNGYEFAVARMGDVYEAQGNKAEALKCYQNYYDLGNESGGSYSLGSFYKKQKKYDEAFKWYKKCYELGNNWVISDIGGMFEEQKKYKEAMNWYLIGAEIEDGSCLYHIGSMYEYGYGVAKNNKEAVRWYRKAYDQGWTFLESSIQKLSK